MKRLIIVLTILLLVPIFAVKAQVPATTTGEAFLIGPTYHNEVWAFRWGVASQLGKYTWGSVLSDFGTSVEVVAEVTALFSPIIESWKIGPVAGFGVDWSGSPGTGDLSMLTYITGATGVASTFALDDYFGFWGYGKYVFAVEENLYESGWTGGVGVWLQLKI